MYAEWNRVWKANNYLVDLAPAGSDPRDVIECRRMLPERALLNIIDEADCSKVQVLLSFSLYDVLINHASWIWCPF